MPTKLKLPSQEEPIEFLKLRELAVLCGRTEQAFKKLIKREIFPECNFRKKSKKTLPNGNPMLGDKLYSKDFLVPKIVAFMGTVKKGQKITLEQKTELKIMFQEEREYFNI